MQNTKLIQILKTFSRQELNEFTKFCSSPFFSTGRDLIPLLNELKKYFPGFELGKDDESLVYERLYPGKKYGDTKSSSLMKTLTSELFKLAKEYLTYMEFNEDESRKEFYRLNQLRKRKLYKEFDKEYAASGKDLKDFPGIGPVDFISLFYNQYAFTQYCVETGKAQEAFDSITSAGELSMIHSLVMAFKHNEVKNTALSYNIELKESFLDLIINHLDSEAVLDKMEKAESPYYPYAAVSYMIYVMNKHPEREEYFFRAKELLNKYIDLFSHAEQYTLCGMLTSYCGRKTETNMSFTNYEFEIYNMELDRGVYKYSPDEDFNINHYRNILLTALDLDEVSWAENFIEKYYKEIRKDNRENMRNFSLAHIHFKKNELDKALAYLVHLKYDFFMFQTDAKYLQFKIYYELGYYEEAFSLLNSITQHLKNSKTLSDAKKLAGNNFVKFARELLKRKTDNNFEDIELMEQNMLKTEYLSLHQWLMSKLQQLKK